jgi:hypothetical protein
MNIAALLLTISTQKGEIIALTDSRKLYCEFKNPSEL